MRVPAKVSGPKPFALRFDVSGRPHCITLKGSDQNSLPHSVSTKLTQWLVERWHRPSGHTVCPRMTLGTNERYKRRHDEGTAITPRTKLWTWPEAANRAAECKQWMPLFCQEPSPKPTNTPLSLRSSTPDSHGSHLLASSNFLYLFDCLYILRHQLCLLLCPFFYLLR